MDERVHSQFPDPHGSDRPENKLRPRTAEQLINHAIHDIDENVTWEQRQDGVYCHLCAPGGYRIKKGASPWVHESQRNPDTHQRNRIWATIKWFEAHKLPIPGWPDCYRRAHQFQLWCHICRTTCGIYGREHAEVHDAWHRTLERVIMRPNRIDRNPAKRRALVEPRRRHIIDEILASRREDYQGVGEGSVDYRPEGKSHFTDPQSQWAKDQQTMRRLMPDDQHPMQDYKKIFGTYFYPDNPDAPKPQMTAEECEELTTQTYGDRTQRWSWSCVFGWCANLPADLSATRHPCPGGGCECTCHAPLEEEV